MRVKHRREGKCKIVLHFSMRVVPRIMMIRPGTGFVPGLFLCAGASKGNMSASISIYFSIIIYIDRRGILLYSIYRPKNI